MPVKIGSVPKLNNNFYAVAHIAYVFLVRSSCSSFPGDKTRNLTHVLYEPIPSLTGNLGSPKTQISQH